MTIMDLWFYDNHGFMEIMDLWAHGSMQLWLPAALRSQMADGLLIANEKTDICPDNETKSKVLDGGWTAVKKMDL